MNVLDQVRELTKIPLYASLRVKGTLFVLGMAATLMVGMTIVMSTSGRTLVYQESSKIFAEKVNRAVVKLHGRLSEIAALTRTEADILKLYPKDEASLRHILPSIIDFNGDQSIAGGGVWPEPYRFDPKRERRSFFWGREATGKLKYLDDYNDPKGAGYHHEEWYVPARHTKEDRCYWSGSYMDPYSYQPMVTCTVPAFQSKSFLGVATVDLKLEGLHEMALELARETGGYIFILDRNNKFISFPMPEEAQIANIDSKGKKTVEFMDAAGLAKKQPAFAPVAEMVGGLNEELLHIAIHSSEYSDSLAKQLDEGSYQIDAGTATLLSAIAVDPYRGRTLLGSTSVSKDFINQQKSMAFAFHVPETYWKVVLVKPYRELVAASSHITWILLSYLSLVVVVAMILSFHLIQAGVVRPLRGLSQVAARVIEGDKKMRVETKGNDEFASLGRSLNFMLDQLAESELQMQRHAQHLENRVLERTQALEQQQGQLVASSKMASLGVMASGVAHEINNPLAIILASSSRLKRLAERQDLDKEQVLQTSEQIKATTQRIAKIVQGLRSFAREGSHDPMEVLSPVKFLQDSLALCEERIKTLGIKLEVALPEMLPLVRCRSVQVSQVILNLLNNAVDAIEGSEDPWIKVIVEFQDEWLRIRIRDSGKGIPKEVADKLMTPFFTTKAVGKGTGLGLSISFGILESQGGRLTLNRESPNTEFLIELPTAKYATEAA